MPVKACYLQYLDDPEIKIDLAHETPVTLGRDRDTGIQDLYVSRRQIECYADFHNKRLILKVVGQPYAGCNGYALLKNETYTLENGDIIELRLGAHEFEVVFETDGESEEEEEEETFVPVPSTSVTKESEPLPLPAEVPPIPMEITSMSPPPLPVDIPPPPLPMDIPPPPLPMDKPPPPLPIDIPPPPLPMNPPPSKLLIDKPPPPLPMNIPLPPPSLPMDPPPSPPPKKTKLDITAFASCSRGPGGYWEESDDRELLIYTSPSCTSRAQIAAFDLDGTLIKTRSGSTFPKTPDDWQLNYHEIPSQLKKLHGRGYKIVIITNQSAIGNDSQKVRDFKRKIEAVIRKIGVPMQVYVATGRSMYRKPAPGMWEALKMKNTERIDKHHSFFVGDAAGREKNWAPKKPRDHSTCDRLFALNINLKFYTPEEYFLRSSHNPFKMPEFDPRKISSSPFSITQLMGSPRFEVILMVGCQGSGKTHFCKTYLVPQSYAHVSRDKLGSWQKCVSVMEEYLRRKKAVVIDNTNPTKENRLRFIEPAKKFNVPIRCFVMDVTFRHSKHNNRYRELIDKSHTKISSIILNSYKKAYEEPQLSEGFAEIIRVPFVPKFPKRDDEKLYKMFLLED